MVVVDTNFLIRFLIRDIPEQFEIVNDVLINSEVLLIPEVVHETVYVLEKVYKIERDRICTDVMEIIFSRNIHLSDRDIYGIAFRYYLTTKLSYVDCVVIAYARYHCIPIKTFDKQMNSTYNKDLL